MGFDALQKKVTEAEQALEARERNAAANWRQFGASWKQAWTPGRIVIAGLTSGFMAGKAGVIERAGGSSILKLALGVSSLITAKAAEVTAEAAQETVQSAEATADAAREVVNDVISDAPTRPLSAADAPHDSARAGSTPDEFRQSGSM